MSYIIGVDMNRGEIRHSCYRMKNGVATDKNKEIAKVVEPLLKEGQTWSNFSTEWDIMLDLNKNIVVIKPELGEHYIHSTCLEKKLYEKKGLSDEEFDNRQRNIIDIVESVMLDGIMQWSNYNEVWQTRVNKENGVVETHLKKQVNTQKPVTEDMIQGSMRAFPIAENPERGVKQEAKVDSFSEMSPEEIEKFQAMLELMKKQG